VKIKDSRSRRNAGQKWKGLEPGDHLNRKRIIRDTRTAREKAASASAVGDRDTVLKIISTLAVEGVVFPEW
jgi:hypothetical protein